MEKEVAISLIVSLFAFLGGLTKLFHWFLKGVREDTNAVKHAVDKVCEATDKLCGIVGVTNESVTDSLGTSIEFNRKQHTITHNKLEQLLQKKTDNGTNR